MAGLVVAGMTAGLGGAAHAGGVVVVPGTSFPDPAHVSLSYVGCDALFSRDGSASRASVGRASAALGERSLGFALSGGTAAGSVFTVASMADTTSASLQVRADAKARGVAYAGYQAPADAGTSHVWLGRADLTTPGGSWQTVSATGRPYEWTHYDLTTGLPLADPVGSSGVADFVDAQGGDGPGFYTLGFGCDGTPFSLDAFRLGATTYDLEGLTTSVTASAAPAAGDAVRLTGRLETSTGDTVEQATMILESRVGSGPWESVRVVDVEGDTASVSVTPEVTTSYRWRFVDRPLADGSVSEPVTVRVAAPSSPSASATPSARPTVAPSEAPSATATVTPTATPTATPSATPSEVPSSEPSEVPSSEVPSELPSEAPMSPEPSPGL